MNFSKLINHFCVLCINLALGFAPILTDLQSYGESGFSWDGKSKAISLDWYSGNPSEIGDCATYNKMGLSSIPCDSPSQYMCEGALKTTSETTKA